MSSGDFSDNRAFLSRFNPDHPIELSNNLLSNNNGEEDEKSFDEKEEQSRHAGEKNIECAEEKEWSTFPTDSEHDIDEKKPLLDGRAHKTARQAADEKRSDDDICDKIMDEFLTRRRVDFQNHFDEDWKSNLGPWILALFLGGSIYRLTEAISNVCHQLFVVLFIFFDAPRHIRLKNSSCSKLVTFALEQLIEWNREHYKKMTPDQLKIYLRQLESNLSIQGDEWFLNERWFAVYRRWNKLFSIREREYGLLAQWMGYSDILPDEACKQELQNIAEEDESAAFFLTKTEREKRKKNKPEKKIFELGVTKACFEIFGEEFDDPEKKQEEKRRRFEIFKKKMDDIRFEEECDFWGHVIHGVGVAFSVTYRSKLLASLNVFFFSVSLYQVGAVLVIIGLTIYTLYQLYALVQQGKLLREKPSGFTAEKLEKDRWVRFFELLHQFLTILITAVCYWCWIFCPPVGFFGILSFYVLPVMLVQAPMIKAVFDMIELCRLRKLDKQFEDNRSFEKEEESFFQKLLRPIFSLLFGLCFLGLALTAPGAVCASTLATVIILGVALLVFVGLVFRVIFDEVKANGVAETYYKNAACLIDTSHQLKNYNELIKKNKEESAQPGKQEWNEKNKGIKKQIFLFSLIKEKKLKERKELTKEEFQEVIHSVNDVHYLNDEYESCSMRPRR